MKTVTKNGRGKAATAPKADERRRAVRGEPGDICKVETSGGLWEQGTIVSASRHGASVDLPGHDKPFDVAWGEEIELLTTAASDCDELAEAAQPAIKPGHRVVVALIDGQGPHTGTVMEFGKWGVLVRIDDDDVYYPGVPTVCQWKYVTIVPAQAQ